METITQWLTSLNDMLWTYVIIGMLLGCAGWFTFKTRFVQFRMLKEMIRLLGDSTNKSSGKGHSSLSHGSGEHLPTPTGALASSAQPTYGAQIAARHSAQPSKSMMTGLL